MYDGRHGGARRTTSPTASAARRRPTGRCGSRSPSPAAPATTRRPSHAEDDDFVQAGDLYRLMSEDEKQRLIDNLAGFIATGLARRHRRAGDRQLPQGGRGLRQAAGGRGPGPARLTPGRLPYAARRDRCRRGRSLRCAVSHCRMPGARSVQAGTRTRRHAASGACGVALLAAQQRMMSRTETMPTGSLSVQHDQMAEAAVGHGLARPPPGSRPGRRRRRRWWCGRGRSRGRGPGPRRGS